MGFEVVTNVHIAGRCSPVGRKDDAVTKDVLFDGTYIHMEKIRVKYPNPMAGLHGAVDARV